MKSSRQWFLAGERAALRPLESEDVPVVAKWMNDGEVTQLMFTGQRPTTRAQVADEVRMLGENPNNVVFLVEDRETGQPIGLAGLYDLHYTARKAEFRILIGESAFWDRGYGTEVTELVTYYGFDRLNLNRIWLGITSENKRGIRAYEKAGFRHEGALRQDIYRNSLFYDSVRMAVVRDEYYPERYEQHAKRFQFPQRGNAVACKKGLQ